MHHSIYIYMSESVYLPRQSILWPVRLDADWEASQHIRWRSQRTFWLRNQSACIKLTGQIRWNKWPPNHAHLGDMTFQYFKYWWCTGIFFGPFYFWGPNQLQNIYYFCIFFFTFDIIWYIDFKISKLAKQYLGHSGKAQV